MYWSLPSTEPNRAWVITSITAAGIEGTENGEPLRLTHELSGLESPREKHSNPQGLRFPLEVGKQWRYTSDWLFKPKNSKGSSVIDAKATIRGVSGINSQIDAETSTIYWYAPAARAVVKSVTRNPYLGTSTVELVAFQLQR